MKKILKIYKKKNKHYLLTISVLEWDNDQLSRNTVRVEPLLTQLLITIKAHAKIIFEHQIIQW